MCVLSRAPSAMYAYRGISLCMDVWIHLLARWTVMRLKADDFSSSLGGVKSSHRGPKKKLRPSVNDRLRIRWKNRFLCLFNWRLWTKMGLSEMNRQMTASTVLPWSDSLVGVETVVNLGWLYFFGNKVFRIIEQIRGYVACGLLPVSRGS